MSRNRHFTAECAHLVYHLTVHDNLRFRVFLVGSPCQYFGEFIQDMDSFGQEVHAVLADDEHGVALVKATATRGDDRLEVNNVLVFHVDNGLATEVWVASTDPYAGDEFWA